MLQNYRVWVGDYPNHNTDKNAECPGGPYQVLNDYNSYVDFNITQAGSGNDSKNKKGKQWKRGAEIWCNKPGRYTTIIADLRNIKNFDYKVGICNVAVMGTKYGRANNEAPSIISVRAGGRMDVTIEKITALIPVGNTLDIKLR